MVRPDLETFRTLARGGAAVPLVREVLADLDTALAIFLKVDDGRYSFLFESNEGGEHWGRYSFIGIGARALFSAHGGRVEIRRGEGVRRVALASDRSEDPLDHLRRLLSELAPAPLPDLPRFSGGAVGYVSYDWVRYVERLPETNPDPLGLPDCWFVFPETVLVHDRTRQRLSIIHDLEIRAGESAEAAYERGLRTLDQVERRLAEPTPRQPDVAAEAAKLEPESNVTRERFVEMVKRCQEYIHAGDIFQVVPSQRFTLSQRCEPFQIYRQLRVLNPSPYLFFMRCGDDVVLGSSPEIHVRLTGDLIELRPLAGTAPRGATPEEDKEIERRLLADPKELAEHVMLVDLGRNDVGRVAEIGSVVVDEFEVVERYSHVMHIVSNVRGRLRAGKDAVDVLRATFPAGTVSGAPKVRAMQVIEEVEPERRGLYAGCVGYFDYHGNMDTCIALRTLLVKGGKLYLQAGGGVVADSDPEKEFQETLHKAGALLRAIALAGRLGVKLLVIDNYDSFTYNLVQYLGELGAESDVVRNDEIPVDDVGRRGADAIVISPGPCTPNEAGISVPVILRYAGRIPILGVCLGHQSIGQAFGGRVVHAKKLMHGKTSQISHQGTDLFEGLPNPFEATRYHSLAVAREGLPSELLVTAETADGEIMGMRHAQHAVFGVQFHPESILTVHGKDLLANFLRLARDAIRRAA